MKASVLATLYPEQTVSSAVTRRRTLPRSTLAAGLLCLGFLAGCAGPAVHKPAPGTESYRETGMASYYARKFQSRKTASGERLDNNALTAAHRSLPFGTEVLVRNPANGKSVRVRINDRGPFVKGRIIDLTRAAFARIARLEDGIAKVEITVMR